MNEEWEQMIQILEESLKRNGDKPITISHLLNLMKMAERVISARDEMNNKMYGNDKW